MSAFIDWILGFGLLWISSGIVIVATGWYAAAVIEPRWPEWWRQHIIADDPELRRF